MEAIDPQPDPLQNDVQNFQMTATSSCPRSTSSYWRPCCPNIIHTLWLVGHLPKLSQCAGDVCFMFQLFKISFPRVLAFFTSRPYIHTQTHMTQTMTRVALKCARCGGPRQSQKTRMAFRVRNSAAILSAKSTTDCLQLMLLGLLLSPSPTAHRHCHRAQSV